MLRGMGWKEEEGIGKTVKGYDLYVARLLTSKLTMFFFNYFFIFSVSFGVFSINENTI